jgi:PST family polysaccharide transporter
MVAQVGAQIVLARLLVPADYGIFSVLILTVTLAGYFGELGGAALLVKKESINDNEIRTQFTLQIIIGLLLFAAAAITAAPVTQFFGLKDATNLMIVVGINPLIIASGIVGSRLLSRGHQFKTIQLINLASYVIGYAFVAMLCANLGWGAWALVAGTLAQSCMASLCYLYKSRHAMRPMLHGPTVSEQFRLGFHAFSSGILTWGLFSLDRLFVGKLFPAQIVGTYASAFNLSVAPVWQITSSVQQQLFAKGSRLASDQASILRSYQTAIFYVIVVVTPLMQIVSLTSTESVSILLGAKWTQVGPILHILALAMPFYVLYGVSSPFIWAKGRIPIDVALQIFTLVIMLAGLYTFVGGNVLEATYVVLSAYAIRALLGMLFTFKELGGGKAQVLQMIFWLTIAALPGLVCELLFQYVSGLLSRNLIIAIGVSLLQCLLNVSVVAGMARLAQGAVQTEAIRALAILKRIVRPQRLEMQS